MTKDQSIQKEAKRLVREFKKNQEKGEFRNKLGRIYWPILGRVIIPTITVLTLSSSIIVGNIPGIIGAAALFGTCFPITEGFSIHVQNIAIQNAGIFGRILRQRKIPYDIRKEAVLEYLNRSGCLFFNKTWVKKNPQQIDRILDKGWRPATISNRIAKFKEGLTREGNFNERKSRKISLSERVQLYRRLIKIQSKDIH